MTQLVAVSVDTTKAEHSLFFAFLRFFISFVPWKVWGVWTRGGVGGDWTTRAEHAIFCIFLLFCFVFLLWFYKMFEQEAVWETETELPGLNMQFFAFFFCYSVLFSYFGSIKCLNKRQLLRLNMQFFFISDFRFCICLDFCQEQEAVRCGWRLNCRGWTCSAGVATKQPRSQNWLRQQVLILIRQQVAFHHWGFRTIGRLSIENQGYRV